MKGCKAAICGQDSPQAKQSEQQEVQAYKVAQEICPGLMKAYKEMVEEGYVRTISTEIRPGPTAYETFTVPPAIITVAPRTLTKEVYEFTTKLEKPNPTGIVPVIDVQGQPQPGTPGLDIPGSNLPDRPGASEAGRPLPGAGLLCTGMLTGLTAVLAVLL